MIDIKEEYRKALRCIGKNDKVIPYRSLEDMRYGTLTVEEYDGHMLIMGQNKNNGGNLIKFAVVVTAEKRIHDMIYAGLCLISIPLVLNYIFSLIAMFRMVI